MGHKLDDDDRALLSALVAGPATPAELAAALDREPEALVERLAWLADNGLLWGPFGAAGGGSSGEGDDGAGAAAVALTSSGRRVLEAPGTGVSDERIDTPPALERELLARRLRADRADAVRKAFAYLRNRGEETAEEVAEAVYPEAPAGYESPGEWWEGTVADLFAALEDDGLLARDGDRLRYVGPLDPDEAAGVDGRQVLGRGRDGSSEE